MARVPVVQSVTFSRRRPPPRPPARRRGGGVRVRAPQPAPTGRPLWRRTAVAANADQRRSLVGVVPSPRPSDHHSRRRGTRPLALVHRVCSATIDGLRSPEGPEGRVATRMRRRVDVLTGLQLPGLLVDLWCGRAAWPTVVDLQAGSLRVKLVIQWSILRGKTSETRMVHSNVWRCTQSEASSLSRSVNEPGYDSFLASAVVCASTASKAAVSVLPGQNVEPRPGLARTSAVAPLESRQLLELPSSI